MMSLLAISQSRPALVAEYGYAGTIQRRTIHGPNADADDPYVQFEGPEIGCTGTRFLYADPRGSIVALADCWGNNQAINAYDEFGIPDTATGNDIATKGRFRYTGQAWIPELGMYYYKARIYSPTLGRFLQTDPIGYEDQFNLYAYVANDPINFTDPTGKCRDRDKAGECVVINKAGEKGKETQSAISKQVNSLDRGIRALDPKAKLSMTFDKGKTTQTMTGKEVQKLWAKMRFTVEPEGKLSGGANGAPAWNSGHHAHFTANGLGAYVDAETKLGGTSDTAHSTIVLHEFGHDSRLDRYVAGDKEQAITNTIGRTIGEATGVEFSCKMFTCLPQ